MALQIFEGRFCPSGSAIIFLHFFAMLCSFQKSKNVLSKDSIVSIRIESALQGT